MGLYEYLMLDNDAQWDVLWRNGAFVEHHREGLGKFCLYALFNFFVEVELHPETDKILRKKHFKDGELLDRYAGNIDIERL